MGFEVVACEEDLTVVTMPGITGAARCTDHSCLRFVSFTARINSYANRDSILLASKSRRKGTFSLTKVASDLKIFPEPPKPDIPEFLPENIHRLFSDAEKVRLLGEAGAGAAVGQYRSVLDKTLHALAIEAALPTTDSKGKELPRFPLLERLSEAELLPSSVREWIGSAGIRKILTAASHGEKITVEQAREMADITRFILVYVFTLPSRVKQARDEFLQNDRS